MEIEDKSDTRDLKSRGRTLNTIKKSIGILQTNLSDAPDLQIEFRNRLIDYILGVL